jgi:hypothetical protein
MTSAITVLIRGGEYPQDTQLTFSPADSGRSGYTVIYKNYPGEQPLVHRGRQLTGWQLDASGIYKVPFDWTPNAIYENGVRAEKARFSNTRSSPI